MQTMTPKEQTYDFKHAQSEWAKPPFDNIGYISSSDALQKSDDELRSLVKKCEANRYALEINDGLCRNYNNRWRESLGLDSTKGKRVLDFGCGMGIEALQFARSGNQVSVADIVPSNALLAGRVLRLFGYEPVETVNVSGEAPFFKLHNQIDIFYSNGVLHHTPMIAQILSRAWEVLAPGGEARLMLYSDKGWTHFVPGELPSIDATVTEHAGFKKFVRAFDSVGDYADWYNPEKIQCVAGPRFTLSHFEYLTKSQWYCTAILRKV